MDKNTRTKGRVFFQVCLLLMLLALPAISEPEREYLEYTAGLHADLSRVNREWNRKVKYELDIDHYGVREKWAYPSDGKGDCEDVAIAKKRALEGMGIESFFAVTKPQNGVRHVVLFVFTNKGALVLDTPADPVRFAKDLPYDWLFVQFPNDIWREYDSGDRVLPPLGYIFFQSGNVKK